MSQFTPPAGPPPGAMPEGTSAAMTRPQSWSALAISGFVLSLLGCLGITAALGLVFGIAGIVATRGGGKRGFRLAVAAIPISLVMGALGAGVSYYLTTMYVIYMERMDSVVAVVGSTPDDSAEAFARLREGCSEEFIEKIDDESLTRWLATIREKHGALVSTDEQPVPVQGGSVRINAKFLNGPAPIVYRFSTLGGAKLLIDYIDVDGLAVGQSP